MNKRQKQKNDNQPERIEITGARTPKKKTVHADPFARIKLHPLEELEARESQISDDAASVPPVDRQKSSPSVSAPSLSLLDFNPDQVEPSKTNQVEPSSSKTKTDQDQVEPSSIKSDQVGASRAKTDQVEPSKTKQKKVETSPSKNYTKVPNSIAKLAIPEKYFRGLSKNTYDILYQQTRGAINPVRTIELTKGELVKLTGLAIHTVKLHIKYLNESGLVVTHRQVGKHTGSVYEVLIPEEIEYDQVEPSTSKTNQNLTRHPDQNLVLLGHTNHLENKELSSPLKTLLKTLKNIDDETPLVRAFESLDGAARKATGKGLTQKDLETVNELFELLINETAIARTRTQSVSSYLKFAVENLRRRLYSKPGRAAFAQKQSPFEPGEPNAAANENSVADDFDAPEPLGDAARENALVIFRSIVREAGIGAMENFRAQHTAEDFSWLMERLPKE